MSLTLYHHSFETTNLIYSFHGVHRIFLLLCKLDYAHNLTVTTNV